MSHALADVVHAEQFQPIATAPGILGLACPVCAWHAFDDESPELDLAALLAAARAHIAEAHTAAAPDELAAVLHAVEAVQGDAYPALIPEAQLADDQDRPVRVCGATGNTIRGPLFPVERPGEPRRFYCRICFGRYRRSVAHVPSPLPIEGDDRG